MAKIDARRIAGFLAEPPATARVVLIYGDDLGLVRERADQLMRAMVGDDPFGLVDVPREAASRDVSLLGGEAAQSALTGGRRLVRVRDATDGLAAAVCHFYQSSSPLAAGKSYSGWKSFLSANPDRLGGKSKKS